MIPTRLHTLNPNRRRRHRWVRRAATLLTASLLAWPAVAEYGDINYVGDEYYQESDNSYSFARVLEGSATLLTIDGEREELEIHQPVLVGDRLWVPRSSRLELVLSDRSLLRVEGDSEISFESIAYSADTSDSSTLLRLHKGDLQLVVPHDVLGDSLPRLETPGASVFIHREGTFRISVGRDGHTEVVVREGLAELVAERGSRLIHVGEAGWGSDRSGIQVSRAKYRDRLERWGDDLSYRAARVDNSYIDSSLRYVSAPLHEYGGWVDVGGRNAWRPHSRYRNAWRPYNRGYWRQTPIGATWVSRDPWGWVTHHYGSWDYDNGYGWVWYPGRRYAPARVHWYSGPSYIGWCPTGYYSNHYRRRHSGYNLNVGIYGWAGGNWGHFGSWSFTANVHFGHRRQHEYVYSGHDLRRRGHRLETGVVTTHLGRHARPGRGAHEIYASLRHEAGQRQHRNGHDLPDVTEFVGRAPLRDRVAQRVLRPADANKPLVINNGARKPASVTSSDGTTIVRGDRGNVRNGGRSAGTTVDKPARLPNGAGSVTRSADRTPISASGKPARQPNGAGSVTRSGDLPRASSADKPGRASGSGSVVIRSEERARRAAGDKPAVTPSTRDRRITSTPPAYDRRRGVTGNGEAATRDRASSAVIPPRTAPDRPTRRTVTPRTETRSEKPGRIVNGSSAGSREGTRRQEMERRDAERRREAQRAEERRREAGQQTRQRPTSIYTAPRTTKPRSTEIRRETTGSSRPSATPSRPRTVTPRATPQRPQSRSVRPPTSRPTTRQAPRPITRPSPAPRPTTRQQAPRPTTRQQAPRPTTRQQAPRPTTRQQAPRPTTRQQAPRPTTRQAAPSSRNTSRGNVQRGGSSSRGNGSATTVRRGNGNHEKPKASNSHRGRRDNARQGTAGKRRDN